MSDSPGVNQRDHRKIVVVDGEHAFAGGVNFSQAYHIASKQARRRGLSQQKALRRGLARHSHRHARHGRAASRGPVSRAPGAMPSARARSAPAAAPRRAKPAIPWCRSSPARPTTRPTISTPRCSRCSRTRRRASTSPWPTSCRTTRSRRRCKDAAQARCRGAHHPAVIQRLLRRVLRRAAPTTTSCWKAACKLFELENAFLHSKSIVVDGVWSSIGSTNFDWRSFVHNNEISVCVIDEDFARQMTQHVRHRPCRLAGDHAGQPGRSAASASASKSGCGCRSNTGCDGKWGHSRARSLSSHRCGRRHSSAGK